MTEPAGQSAPHVSRPAAAAVAIALSVCILAVHLPGSLSQDSLYMLNEALTKKIGQFDEWYSPAFVLLWSGMISTLRALELPAFAQVSSMCVLQTVLIVGGICQLLRVQRGMTRLRLAIAATGIVMWPAVSVYFGEVWRDVLMAAFLLVSVCLLDLYARTKSSKIFATALTILLLAALIRQNAIVAEVPLLMWASLLWTKASGYRWTRAILPAVGLVFVVAGFVWVSNRVLASTSYGRGASSIMYYDLMGISVRTNELLLPGSLSVPDYSLQTVRARYQAEYNDLTGLILPTTPQQMSIITTVWRRAVMNHPRAYLSHRWAVTKRFLGISDLPHLPYQYGIPDSLYPDYVANPKYHVKFPMNSARTRMAQWLTAATYWFFRPWFYGLCAIVLLVLCKDRFAAPFWLCASGGLYWVSCFWSVPSTDFRYSWWNVLAVLIASALLLASPQVSASSRWRRSWRFPC